MNEPEKFIKNHEKHLDILKLEFGLYLKPNMKAAIHYIFITASVIQATLYEKIRKNLIKITGNNLSFEMHKDYEKFGFKSWNSNTQRSISTCKIGHLHKVINMWLNNFMDVTHYKIYKEQIKSVFFENFKITSESNNGKKLELSLDFGYKKDNESSEIRIHTC